MSEHASHTRTSQAAPRMPAHAVLAKALEAVRAGQLERVETILENTQAGPALTLPEVFRLYQTELEAQAQQLRESQAQTEATLLWFTQLFQSLPVAALMLDAGGQIVEANACACQLLDLPLDRRLGSLPLRRLLPGGNDDLRLFRALHETRETGQSRLDEQGLVSLAGKTVWVDLLLTRAAPREGMQDISFVCTLIDLTERVSAQRAQARSSDDEHRRELAEEASRAKTELLSRVSHELRTPLNAVIGFGQLLQQEPGAIREDRLPYLQHIVEAGNDLLGLVDEILQINRAEAGRMRLELGPVALADAAGMVLAQHQPMASPLHLTLSLQAQAGQPPARADAGRVREILANLVSNAVKYNRQLGWVKASFGHDARSTWVEVSDSGCGMSVEQVSHLFEPFNRLGAERHAATGFGLGLSICKTYCEAMGGRLEVRSLPGQGSAFRLSLPRSDADDDWSVPTVADWA